MIDFSYDQVRMMRFDLWDKMRWEMQQRTVGGLFGKINFNILRTDPSQIFWDDQIGSTYGVIDSRLAYEYGNSL